jgi:tetratricopeptide (TPR) repeat protein
LTDQDFAPNVNPYKSSRKSACFCCRQHRVVSGDHCRRANYRGSRARRPRKNRGVQHSPDNTQRDGAEQLRRQGITSAAWLPLACDPEVHRKHPVDKTCVVCFVGNVFPGPRADLLDLLQPRWRGLGDLLLRQDRRAEAGGLAERLLADGLLRGEGMVLQARITAARGDTAGARRQLEQAVRDRPDDLEPLRGLCQILFEHGSPAEARRALLELIRQDPHDASAYHNLGTVYYRTGRYAAAVDAYRQSLKHRPRAPGTQLHLGYVLEASGQLDEAIAAWQEVLRLAPDNAEAAEALRRARALTIHSA